MRMHSVLAEHPKSHLASVSTTLSCWWWPRPESLVQETFVIWHSCQRMVPSALPKPEGHAGGRLVLQELCCHLSQHGRDLVMDGEALMFSQCTGSCISQTQCQVFKLPGNERGVFVVITHLVARDCSEACLADFSA